MAKKDRATPARGCVCDKCNVSAHAIPGSQHRRCGGSDGANLKDKDKKANGADRGKWSA